MKRFVLPLALVLLLAAAGAFLLRRMPSHVRQVAAWLPANTILFEDMPDLHRTAERWPDTALSQILQEPEVQAFLARPLGRVPSHVKKLEDHLSQVGGIDPSQLFLAVTDLGDGGAPKAIAGLSYTGSKEQLDSLLDQLRKAAQKEWPAGRSDIQPCGSGDIETFTTPGFSAGLAYRGRWLFVSTDVTLLKATLDRSDAPAAPDCLAQLPAFQNCIAHMPPAPDNIFFLRPGMLADKAGSLALMLNPTAGTQGMDGLKKIDAMASAAKLDGEVMRDATFVLKPESGAGAPLARDSLKLSSTDTIVAVSERVQGLAGLPDLKEDPFGLMQLIGSYLKVFQDQGLGPRQLDEAFGPESGFVLDWPSGSVIPTPLVMMDVRKPALAARFLDTLATVPIAGGPGFTRQVAGGIAFYTMPQMGMVFLPLQLTLGLTPKCVIGALNEDGVRLAAKRWDSGSPGIAGTIPFQQAAALVAPPTISFTYVDTKAVFERIYGLFRSVASMGFVPHLSDYVDISKLPAPETISRHLSPIVASGAVKDGGLLMESAGPVTTMQALTVTALVLGAAAIPIVEQELKGQSVTIPGFPGFNLGSPGASQFPFATPSSPGLFKPGSSPALPPPPSPPSVPPPPASPSGGTP